MIQGKSTYIFGQAVVGGTFDRLHLAHRNLLDMAFTQAAFVTIGLTTREMTTKKYLSETIQSYLIREKQLQNYLQKKHVLKRSAIIPISDIYGITLSQKNLDSVFINNENSKNADIINYKREQLGFPKLQIVKIPDVLGQDHKKISSLRIRSGEIDREGFVYSSLFTSDLFLPEKLRPVLRKPIGTITPMDKIDSLLSGKKLVISVGDIVTLNLLTKGIRPEISIIDLKTRRQELQKKQVALLSTLLTNSKYISNQRGTIRSGAVELLSKMIFIYLSEKTKQTLAIEGEEDLLTLPAILLSPLSTIVLYGQYEKGLISVEVTEEKKKLVTGFIKKFSHDGIDDVM